MKFESGRERKIINDKKKGVEQPTFFEKYLKYNQQEKPELFEKRKQEEETFKKRQENKIEKLREAADKGEIVYKDR